MCSCVIVQIIVSNAFTSSFCSTSRTVECHHQSNRPSLLILFPQEEESSPANQNLPPSEAAAAARLPFDFNSAPLVIDLTDTNGACRSNAACSCATPCLQRVS